FRGIMAESIKRAGKQPANENWLPEGTMYDSDREELERADDGLWRKEEEDDDSDMEGFELVRDDPPAGVPKRVSTFGENQIADASRDAAVTSPALDNSETLAVESQSTPVSAAPSEPADAPLAGPSRESLAPVGRRKSIRRMMFPLLSGANYTPGPLSKLAAQAAAISIAVAGFRVPEPGEPAPKLVRARPRRQVTGVDALLTVPVIPAYKNPAPSAADEVGTQSSPGGAASESVTQPASPSPTRQRAFSTTDTRLPPPRRSTTMFVRAPKLPGPTQPPVAPTVSSPLSPTVSSAPSNPASAPTEPAVSPSTSDPISPDLSNNINPTPVSVSLPRPSPAPAPLPDPDAIYVAPSITPQAPPRWYPLGGSASTPTATNWGVSSIPSPTSSPSRAQFIPRFNNPLGSTRNNGSGIASAFVGMGLGAAGAAAAVATRPRPQTMGDVQIPAAKQGSATGVPRHTFTYIKSADADPASQAQAAITPHSPPDSSDATDASDKQQQQGQQPPPDPKLEAVTCPLCADVCEVPLSLGCCRKIACADCLVRWLKEGGLACPFCRGVVVPKQIKPANTVNKLADSLR
ncbi:hypothetical protein HK104_006437, partial [Borealophlyctis nickersoniae]